ncbi:MAG: glycosyltransferase family 39 protein, partial [Candidatus Wallbacteria bacterium]|nr:glycosyltransferase family 39 protein [Candidatus Wallbacteria bacterium]
MNQSLSPARLIAPMLVLLMAWQLYTAGLSNRVLVGDDEGEFTYAAWRQSLGERVYRDVAFDAAPVPVYLGALAYQVAGATHLVTKKLTVVFALLAALFSYLLAERLMGRETALLATALLVTNAYWHFFNWFFTADAYYICFHLASLYFFVCAWQEPERRGPWLMSGVLGSIGFFSKFFGVFAFGGSFLFLAVELLGRRGEEGDAAPDPATIARGVAWMLAGAVAAALFFLLPMWGYLDRFYALCVLHHRKAVPTLAPGWIFYAFFDVLWFAPTPIAHKLLVFLGLLGLFGAASRPARGRMLLACHAVQALVFLVVKMELYARHLLFLVPLLSILAADQLVALASEKGEARRLARWLTGWILVTALLGFSSDLPGYKHWKLVELVQKLVPPEGTVLAEHGEIAFLAQRRNVPLRDVPASGSDPASPRMDAREVVEA